VGRRDRLLGVASDERRELLPPARRFVLLIFLTTPWRAEDAVSTSSPVSSISIAKLGGTSSAAGPPPPPAAISPRVTSGSDDDQVAGQGQFHATITR
jgi:hypothetical protein